MTAVATGGGAAAGANAKSGGAEGEVGKAAAGAAEKLKEGGSAALPANIQLVLPLLWFASSASSKLSWRHERPESRRSPNEWRTPPSMPPTRGGTACVGTGTGQLAGGMAGGMDVCRAVVS